MITNDNIPRLTGVPEDVLEHFALWCHTATDAVADDGGTPPVFVMQTYCHETYFMSVQSQLQDTRDLVRLYETINLLSTAYDAKMVTMCAELTRKITHCDEDGRPLGPPDQTDCLTVSTVYRGDDDTLQLVSMFRETERTEDGAIVGLKEPEFLVITESNSRRLPSRGNHLDLMGAMPDERPGSAARAAAQARLSRVECPASKTIH